jgi:hypothetical protein
MAKSNQELGLAIIKAALSYSRHISKTHCDDLESFPAYFKDKGSILIDTAEEYTQRPADSTYQQQMCSG